MQKKIEIKKGVITIPTPEGPKDFYINTLQLISQVLDFVPQRGIVYSDFKQRKRVDDAIEAQIKEAGGSDKLQVIILEKEEYDTLVHCALSMTWNNRSNFIYEFLDQFE